MRVQRLWTAVAIAGLAAACSSGGPTGAAAPAGAAAATAPAWPPAVPAERLGISGGGSFVSTSTRLGHVDLDRMAAAGIRRIRVDFLWEEIERQPGVYDFGVYDAFVAAAEERGIKVLGLICYGNTLHSRLGARTGDATVPPDDPRAMGRFVEALVEHYAGRITEWEFWNEPNAGFRFWGGSLVGDPAAYARLLHAVRPYFEAAAPPGTRMAYAGLFYPEMFVYGAPRFLDESLAAVPGLCDDFDALAFHPYPIYPPTNGPLDDGYGETPVPEMVRELRGVLDRHGCGDKPLWATEYGWPTHGLLDAATQAEYVALTARILHGLAVERIFVFTFWDHDPAAALYPAEARFGLWTDPGPTGAQARAKPAWHAFTDLAQNP